MEIESGIKPKPVFAQPRKHGEFFKSGTSKEPTQKCKAFRPKGPRSWPSQTEPHRQPKLAVPMPVFNRLTLTMVRANRRQRGVKD